MEFRNGLWLPENSRMGGEKRTGHCRICGTTLLPSEAARHVAQCYRRNEADVRMLSLREKAPAICGDEGVDTEFLDYWKQRGVSN